MVCRFSTEEPETLETLVSELITCPFSTKLGGGDGICVILVIWSGEAERITIMSGVGREFMLCFDLDMTRLTLIGVRCMRLLGIDFYVSWLMAQIAVLPAQKGIKMGIKFNILK